MTLLALAGVAVPLIGLWLRYHLDEAPRDFCNGVARINRAEAIALLGFGAYTGFVVGGRWWLLALVYGGVAVSSAVTARRWQRIARRTPA